MYSSVRPSGSSVPWDQHEHLPGYQDIIALTLFGIKYLLVILDEAHEFRNTGPKHSAALAIMALASLRVVMTATPLQTNTKVSQSVTKPYHPVLTFQQDLAAMGRLIGIQHFLSPQAFSEEKGWQAMLRRLRRESMDDTKAEDISATDYDPYKSMQCEIAQKIRLLFGDRLLRRTLKSVDSNNRLLIDLPPLIEETFIIELQPWELEIIDNLTAKVAAECVYIPQIFVPP